jgi:hypothetical protein
MSIIISEYQEGTRNARVYKTNVGYGIMLFDAADQYDDVTFADFLEDAEAYAESWVLQT